MAKIRKRNLTAQQQLARGPVDLPFLMLVLLLTGMGVITVFSASFASAYYEDGNPMYYFLRQTVFATGGILVMWLVSRVNYQTLRRLSKAILVFSIILLLLVKVPGIGITRNGASRWVRVPILNQFQPSELAKVAVILVFAAGLSRKTIDKGKQPGDPGGPAGVLLRVGRSIKTLLPYIGVLGIVELLLLWEPHMSGMILVLVGAAAVLFAAGLSWWLMAIGGGAAGLALLFIMTHTDYMSKRFAIMNDPWSDPQGSGFQTIQSLYAVGSGGLLGRGFGKSIQKFLYLPEEHNDYIFAIWCEEMGFVGAILVLVLFALLILRGYWLAIHARDKFGALIIVGITTLMAAQVFLNVAVVTNIIPPTGISLPFFSYGGSALLVQLLEMGIVLSVSRQIEAPPLG